MSEKFLNSDRISELWSKTKEYVDNAVSGSGDTAVLVKSPIGTIVIWSGTADNIPTGWQFCDGTNGTPDLRDKFVLGAGTAHSVGETGGSEEVTLTAEQMPSHGHSKLKFLTSGGGTIYGYANNTSGSGHTNIIGSIKMNEAGSDQPHPNMPPYFALCYIMKITADPADGVTQEELTAALADKQNTLVNGTGTTIQGSAVNVTTPVNGIVTQAQFDALPEVQKNTGMYVVKEDGDGSGGGGGSGSQGEVYSTEETRIGTWIDRKPLYRKCWVVSGTEDAPWSMSDTAPAGTSVSKTIKFQVSDEDLKTIFDNANVKKRVFLYESGKWKTPYITLAYTNFIVNLQIAGSASMYVGVAVNATKYTSASATLPNVYHDLSGTIILEYTKSTDQPEVTP